MDMRDVKSSNIAAIGYDSETRTLEVHFARGGKYLLHNVEPEIFEQFLQAPSPGSYYAKNIRNFYEFTRIGESDK